MNNISQAAAKAFSEVIKINTTLNCLIGPCLLSEGLSNAKCIRTLDISQNNITAAGAEVGYQKTHHLKL